MKAVKKIKILLLSLTAFVALACFAPPPAYAATDCSNPTAADLIRCGANAVGGESDGDKAASSINQTIRRIINVLSVIIGVIAVVMVIFAGFRYITSGGAADKVKGAKDTLLYAIIGLILVALAQIIVRFVLTTVTPQPPSPPPPPPPRGRPAE